jgi:hypothetical protein
MQSRCGTMAFLAFRFVAADGTAGDDVQGGRFGYWSRDRFLKLIMTVNLLGPCGYCHVAVQGAARVSVVETFDDVVICSNVRICLSACLRNIESTYVHAHCRGFVRT